MTEFGTGSREGGVVCLIQNIRLGRALAVGNKGSSMLKMPPSFWYRSPVSSSGVSDDYLSGVFR